MKSFPYDKLYPVLMEELKALFSRFIEQNKDKKPYFFALKARDCIAADTLTCLYAIGNTMVDFETRGRASAVELHSGMKSMIAKMEADGESEEEVAKWHRLFEVENLYYYYRYNSEEWINKTFTDNDFPKSNAIILDFYEENEENVFDEDENVELDGYDRDSGYSDEFIKFRMEFFNFLIKSLKQLRDEKYFESVYPERILINFEVREYFSEEEMIHIFEELNTKEEAKLFARFLYG